LPEVFLKFRVKATISQLAERNTTNKSSNCFQILRDGFSTK